MPDDRLFHKRLGHSAKVTTLTDFEYIVWQAFVLSADDFGVVRFSAISLQSDHDRLASKSAKAVQRAFERVRSVGLLETFTHQGREYAFQCDWQDWQHIDYPRATNNPKPDDDALARCSEQTRQLFEQHPGGWRGKKRGNGGNLPAHLPKVSDTPTGNLPENLPKVSAIPDPKPLAVSRKPLASSHKPLAVVPPAAATARSSRPIYTSDRFAVFEWQLDELSKMLGPHVEAFDLHAFFDDLSRQSRDAGLVIPKDAAWKWLQAQVLAEAKRRGLPIVSVDDVPKRDRAAEERAFDERLLAEIQQEARRAGR